MELAAKPSLLLLDEPTVRRAERTGCCRSSWRPQAESSHPGRRRPPCLLPSLHASLQSGLDATVAADILSALTRVSRLGATIVAVVHQVRAWKTRRGEGAMGA